MPEEQIFFAPELNIFSQQLFEGCRWSVQSSWDLLGEKKRRVLNGRHEEECACACAHTCVCVCVWLRPSETAADCDGTECSQLLRL